MMKQKINHIMKKILIICTLILLLAGCKKDDFWTRFGPEVLYYQYERVETADFIEITLSAGITEYNVKARCSAPNELAEIEIFRNGTFVRSITDFSNEAKPTEYFLEELMTGITSDTVIRVTATDKNGKQYTKEFTIKTS
jgi:uncharacterized lipoprotein YajG